MSHRIKRVNQLIKEELGKTFLRELELPKGCLATITKVEVSADLRWADIWISLFPEKCRKRIFEKLKTSSGYFWFLLKKKLPLKTLPRLRFKLDQSAEEAEKLENLLSES